MTDQQRKSKLGRILTSVFVRAIFDLKYTSEFVLARALQNAYANLGLINSEDAKKFVKKAKGEDVKCLAERTEQSMKHFNDTGDGETDYRIITEIMFQDLTRSSLLKRSAKDYGRYIRGVMLEESKRHGITKQQVEEYLKAIFKEDIWSDIRPVREEYQSQERERKKAREQNAKYQRAFRDRQRALKLANLKQTGQPISTQPFHNPEQEANTPTTPDIERVADSLLSKHPRKSANKQRLTRAIGIALSEIAPDELINAHERQCKKWRAANTETRYIPKLVKWLTDRSWLDAPRPNEQITKQLESVSSGCGECGVFIG